MKKRILAVLLFAAGLSWLAYERTVGFSPFVLAPPCLNYQEEPLSPTALEALAQPYRYLARGRQSFVFESADGKFVLKFFNASYLNRGAKKLRRQFFKESYRLAWNELRQETGLLYVHQSPVEFPLPQVSITDRLGNTFCLDLQHTAFVLQKKGMCLAEALPQIAKEEGIEGIKKVIDAWFSFVAMRMQKGIADRDTEMVLNFGLEEGVLFHLDPGRLYEKPHMNTRTEWDHMASGFRKWLEINNKEAIFYFDEQFCKNVCK